VSLRFVGLFEKGLFQSEVLISEKHFKEHFPSRTGYSFFLLDPPPGTSAETADILERRLGDYGFDVTPTQERLQRFQAVFNTYLATFQTLGGLGLLLGTLGLAAILLRNVVERRGELATLRALGFKRDSLGWLVVAENAFLLVIGVAIGTASALVAVAPHLLQGNALVPWTSLALTLLAILAVGMLACAAAVRGALRAPLLPALKAD
jgi:ABC-type antimicrobial peptide transport system permease subunit